ncbi:C-reactive protein-like [Styela clava]|uniref:C-reactive protein-like n=1 Tax=Styela clava TaxID=7725 RepID=UPI00193AA1E4|nr:C-reactive protein-like [Styela clava]
MSVLYAILVFFAAAVFQSQCHLPCDLNSCRLQVVCDSDDIGHTRHPEKCPQTAYIFPGGQQTTDFIRLKSPIPQMRELSICAWMTPKSGSNVKGAFVSYSTSRMDNAFLVFFEGGSKLTLYYNQVNSPDTTNFRMTTRTHFCISLETFLGTAKIYVNGALFQTRTFASERNEIEGGGGFIIGQEQDSFVGGFDGSQSFAGVIENFMMWNRALSPEEITTLYQDPCMCPKHHMLHLALHEIQVYGKVTAQAVDGCQ